MKNKIFIIIIILITIVNCSHKVNDSSKSVNKNIVTNNIIDNKTINQLECDLPKKITNELGMEFVFIPAGSFMMGTPDNFSAKEPNEIYHNVVLNKGFYMQTTEVTQGTWKKIMGYNPSFFKQCGNTCPVENVTWIEVQDFIKKLNEHEKTNLYRLPTESEWEYVCKSGKTHIYKDKKIDEKCKDCAYKHNCNDCEDSDEYENCENCGYEQSLDNISWYYNNSKQHTHPVKMKDPNKYGIYDMIGNVWEWCLDWHAEYPMEKVTVNPMGPESGNTKIRRGGAWNHYGYFNRCSYRSWKPEMNRHADTGFRLIKEIDYKTLCNKSNKDNESFDNVSMSAKSIEKNEQSYFKYDFPVVFFDINSNTIKTEMTEVLNKIAEKIKTEKKPVIIEGFTCDLASEAFNYKLGEKRAKAVKNYLLNKGVKEEYLKIKSFGETKPKYPNTSEFNRKLNRRVEIKYFNEKD